MSAYAETKTTLRDEKHLCAALAALGFAFETHAEPQTLIGWHGETRPQKANIIIRRANTGLAASNDVGFVRQSDGTYAAIISDYDSSKFDGAWLGRVKQEYSVAQRIEAGRAKGYVYMGREQQGARVQLRFGVR